MQKLKEILKLGFSSDSVCKFLNISEAELDRLVALEDNPPQVQNYISYLREQLDLIDDKWEV